MSSPLSYSHSHKDESLSAALQLASYFDGTVLDADYNVVLSQEGYHALNQPETLESHGVCLFAEEPTDLNGRIQLNLFAHAARTEAPGISLSQIRSWYKIASRLGRPASYQNRITAIGIQFRLDFSSEDPDLEQTQVNWDSGDIENWRRDLSHYELIMAQAAIPKDPIQLNLPLG